jgi:outer membrane lipoprotein carrier protein
MKFALKLLSTAAVVLSPLFAQAAAIEQLQAFLQSTRTLKADFAQTVVSRGGRKPQESSGTVAILRPGKLRWQIRKPYPQLIVGDGEKIWIHDQELKQVTVRKAGQAISGSPAALLAGKNELERDFVLGEAGNADGLAWVEAVPRQNESGFERVRLGFAGGDLKAMELHDSFGQTTHIRFTNLQRNVALPESTFRFVPPPGADVVGE